MPKPYPWLPIALVGLMLLAGCGRPAVNADAQSSRGLKVEAYDAPIGKAPRGAKLETMGPHEQAVAASSAPPTSSAPAAASDAPQAAADGPPVRLAIERIADRARLAPAAPLVAPPHHDLYDDHPAPAAAPPEPAGFRLTVPLCRRAERQNDPLAQTAECAQLLGAAKAQAETCKRAFETGDDKAVLSEGCRQAAKFR
jgi:hypothetical protein